jgi:hypothetical protein
MSWLLWSCDLAVVRGKAVLLWAFIALLHFQFSHPSEAHFSSAQTREPSNCGTCGKTKMILKMEKHSDSHSTTIRLIGRMHREHLDELKAQLKDGRPKVVLDLNELRLVDVEVVRFLGTCQREGVELLHCSPYISEWIMREQDRKK